MMLAGLHLAETEVKNKDFAEDEYKEPSETLVKMEESEGFDLESKIEVEEDILFKTESADLSEFIEETNANDHQSPSPVAVAPPTTPENKTATATATVTATATATSTSTATTTSTSTAKSTSTATTTSTSTATATSTSTTTATTTSTSTSGRNRKKPNKYADTGYSHHVPTKYKPKPKVMVFKCSKCSCSFGVKRNLNKHSKVCTGVGKSILTCTICSLSFRNRAGCNGVGCLAAGGRHDLRYMCTICGDKTYLHRNYVYNHINKFHPSSTSLSSSLLSSSSPQELIRKTEELLKLLKDNFKESQSTSSNHQPVSAMEQDPLEPAEENHVKKEKINK